MSRSEDERVASPQPLKDFLFLMRMMWRIYINFALMVWDQTFAPPLKGWLRSQANACYGSEAKWQMPEVRMMLTVFLVASRQLASPCSEEVLGQSNSSQSPPSPHPPVVMSRLLSACSTNVQRELWSKVWDSRPATLEDPLLWVGECQCPSGAIDFKTREPK